MNLEGSLDSFSLPDVFALLSLTKKTGGLSLHGQSGRGVVYLCDGLVTGAVTDATRPTFVETDDDSGEIEIQARAREHIVDAVCEVLGWADGAFAFVVDDVNPHDVGLRLPVDEVLTQAEARKSQWDELADALPSPGQALVLAESIAADATLTPSQWRVLRLADARHSLGDLVDEIGATRFDVVRDVAALMGAGLLEAVEMAVAAPEVTEVGTGPGTNTAADPAAPDLQAAPELAATPDPSERVEAPAPAASNGHAPRPSSRGPEPEGVIPARPEPFIPNREPDHAEPVRSTVGMPVGGMSHHTTMGSAAIASEPDDRTGSKCQPQPAAAPHRWCAGVVMAGKLRRRGGQAVKIVVTGPFAAGKTTLIRTISEITVLSTERNITDSTKARKAETTVAMDFGRITIDRELVLYLFGTPGQDRFDFMWEILGEGMLGYLVLIDADREDSLAEAMTICQAFRRMARVPFVVALNRADDLDEAGRERIRDVLDLPMDVPVLPCNATDRESVKEVLLALLYCVLDELEAEAVRV